MDSSSKTIRPASRVKGRIAMQGDKSISHRAIILGALSEEPCSVDNFLVAEDTLCTLEAFRAMGIAMERAGTQVRMHGRGLEGLKAPVKPIWCGNSGTMVRLLMGVLTGQPFQVRLEGDASLSSRPMNRIIEPLSKMGAFFLDLKESPAHLPLNMRGAHTVHPILWKSPVASAQVKSAILLAGLYASGETQVQEPSLSRDHTERMLAACGVTLERSGAQVRLFGSARIRARHFYVPGDLSSAAFFLAAGLLASPDGVEVENVGVNPTRTGFLDIVQAMGGQITRQKPLEKSGEPVATIVARKSSLKAARVSGDLIPRAIDEFPILAVLATQAAGLTIISDAQELRIKETDRIAKTAQELSKMGAHITEKPDGLLIDGPTPLKGAVVDSHGDHRLAMSLAIAGLVAEGTTTIRNTDCVNTSFPEFWTLLETLCGH
jgi:3-phosphoshikimate 1-carboxyvinyltransferase